MQVEEESIWMTKPGYPRKYLKVVHIDPEWPSVVRCCNIANPGCKVIQNLFDMDINDLKAAYVPCTDAAKVLYGDR